METIIPVNEILKDEITKLNSTLIPPECQGDVRTVRIMQESLGMVIDLLGVHSAAAQGLRKIITSAEILRNAPSHVVYLLKDAGGQNGNGEIIGYLKVAHKHLYLFDSRDKLCEVEPLCVLDFYVSGARQRRGNGKKLFDYMLQDTGSQPHDLAVDGPSLKMETFLVKNYGVDRLIRQNNNFAVSPAFFARPPETHNSGVHSQSGRTTPVLPTAAVGRFTARQLQSTISDVIHGPKGPAMYKEKQTTAAPRPQPSPSPEPEPVLEARPPASTSLERPTTLSVAPANSADRPAAGSVSPRRDSQLTDEGHFNIKFYHNKLW